MYSADKGKKITQNIAQLIRPSLERQLVKHYGNNWLDAVNQRLADNGKLPIGGICDSRACIKLFAHDPATDGWASTKFRQLARELLPIANDAYHDMPIPQARLDRAREIRDVFRKAYPPAKPVRAPKPGTVREQFSVPPEPEYRRRGRDVSQLVVMTAEEARCGVVKRVRIDYPENLPDKTVAVRFPANLSDLQEVRIRGYGLPGNDEPGDARFIIFVESD